MPTEDIKIQDGKIVVDRIDPYKNNVDVALSDVDSVSFVRGGEADGQSDGSLILHTKKDGDVVIRVADDDAGKVLTKVYGSLNKKEEEKEATVSKTASKK